MQPVCSWTHGTIQQPGANVGSCGRVYTMLDCMCCSRSIESQLWLPQNNCRVYVYGKKYRESTRSAASQSTQWNTIGKYWCPLDHSDTTAINRQVAFTVPKIVSIILSFALSATCSKIVNVHRPNIMHSAFSATYVEALVYPLVKTCIRVLH